MTKEQIIQAILERMEDKGVELKNLAFYGDYTIEVNELEIHITYSGDQATIFYDGKSKRVGFIEDLAKEVVALLPEEEWEAGQEVMKDGVKRIVVTQQHEEFNLLDDFTYNLEYKWSFSVAELKEMGWERV